METKYLLILILAFIMCIGVFLYQYNNDVVTYMIINETQVDENGTIHGLLRDAYGHGVENRTVTFHKPGHEMGTSVSVETGLEGEFTIDNVEYLPDAGNDNYYGDFVFAGDDKYQGCSYEGNVTVIPKWLSILFQLANN